MSNIENLFKHKIPFNIISSGIDIGEPYIDSLVIFYGTKTIKNGNSIDVYCIHDLFNKLKPFLSYLQSITTETTVSNIDFHEYKTSYNKYLRFPFEIYVRVSNYYYDSLQYNDHPILPKPLEDSFKVDSCVICLENEPNILFNDCNHICTCLECEKIKPSVKCPYCRTEISKRIKI